MDIALLEAPERTREWSAIEPRDPDVLYEVIDGKEVELASMSAESAILAGDLSSEITLMARPQKLGSTYQEALIKLNLKDGRERNRRPDLLFVSETKWPANRSLPKNNAWEILPDLCVEVASPSDHVSELETKIDEYFEAGVRQVWVIHTEPQKVKIYTSKKQANLLWPGDTLTGGDILPGFELPLNRLFRNEPKREEK